MSDRAVGSYSKAWRKFTTIVLPPIIRGTMRHEWSGQDHFPASGGMIVAANHLSYADVLALCLYVYRAGRYPVFLAKESLFRIKVIGTVVRGAGQLPVYRGQSDAALVLRDAEQGVRNGACVVFYPEGTVTRDPDLWPMLSKTGIARLALATGAPVIPLASWGAQDVLPYGSFKPHIIPRRLVKIAAGPPVDLSEFADLPIDNQTMRAATDKVMAEVTQLLAKLRGETPPAQPYHAAIARREARQRQRQVAAAGETSQSDPGEGEPGESDPGEAGAEAGEAEISDGAAGS